MRDNRRPQQQQQQRVQARRGARARQALRVSRRPVSQSVVDRTSVPANQSRAD